MKHYSQDIKNGATFFSICLVFFCCTSKNAENIIVDKNGVVKELVIPTTDNGKTLYLFYENGKIKAINNFNNEGLLDGEQLWFYPSGQLERKVSFAKNKAQGNAFYYYDKTGAAKSFRYFRDGKQVLFGIEYWNDSLGVIKSSLHFNDSGQLYYKKNFDQSGNFLDEEGNRK